MNIYKSVLTECLLGSPFVPVEKCSVVGAAAIAGGAALLGSLLSAKSQDKANEAAKIVAAQNLQSQRETNEMNYRIAQESNKLNVDMMHEQNAFNEEMWNKANQYNLETNKVARLKAAGINPVYGLGSAYNAQDVSSAGFAGAQTAHMQVPINTYHQNPINYDFSGVGNAAIQAVTMSQQQKVTDSQANYNNAKASYEWASTAARLQQDLANAHKGSAEYELAKRRLDLFNDTYQAQVKATENAATMSDKEIDKYDVEIGTAKIMRDIQQKNLDWLDKLNTAQYNSIYAGINEAYSRIKVNDADAAYKAAETAVSKAREEGLKISNEQADQLVEIVVDQAEIEALGKAKAYSGGDFLGKQTPGLLYNAAGAADYPKKRALRRAYRQAHRK